jgi:hypothetical protein
MQPGVSVTKFKVPEIIQTTNHDSIETWNSESINEVFPRFVGNSGLQIP